MPQRLIDLMGKTFGRLTVVRRVENQKGQTRWLCECSCGNTKEVAGGNLRDGRTQSCGCLAKELMRARSFHDLSGQTFGRLVVRRAAEYNKHSKAMWECICSCGIVRIVCAANLLNGNTKSCGCLNRDLISERRGAKLEGKRFGRLIVVERRHNDSRDRRRWMCRCDCDGQVVVDTSSLRNGNTKSCGCLARETASESLTIDISGKHFGRLQVVRRHGSITGGEATWLCRCACGAQTVVRGYSLRSGQSKSCGCLVAEMLARTGTDHPNWDPDRTSATRVATRSLPKNKEFIKAVLAADNYTCQVCGKRGGDICAHHVRNYKSYPLGRFDPENGTTLCRDCHILFHKTLGYRNNTQLQLGIFRRGQKAKQAECQA